MLYRIFFRLVLERIDSERAHGLGLRALKVVGRMLPVAKPSPRLAVEAFGRTFPTPLGVAAGVDKNATSVRGLVRLGFGHVEIGTVTAHAQPGNARPRVFRLPKQRALINRMGFPNDGADAVAHRLRGERGDEALAINVGKGHSVALQDAAPDYAKAVRALAPLADFLVVNVSSPNTPGLRDLQAIEPLQILLREVQGELADLSCPLLVKISPDLADEAIDEITDLAIELGLAGIVCTNTTTTRDGLPDGDHEAGGLSGEPLKQRSLAVLRRVGGRAEGRLTLISVGGVSDAHDVWERLVAGATLVQAYTGFVYGGPLWPRRVNRNLLKRLKTSGLASIADVIGSEADVQIP